MRTILALVLALEPATPSEPEPDPKAEPARTDAATLFQLGLYDEAAEAFAREYETNPDPALLFGRAVSLKRSGDCLSAGGLFCPGRSPSSQASEEGEGSRVKGRTGPERIVDPGGKPLPGEPPGTSARSPRQQ